MKRGEAIFWGIVASLTLSLSPGFTEEADEAGSTSVSRFAADDTVEYLPGSLPLVIGAPHGGLLAPDRIPDRREGVTVSDRNTDLLARAIAEAIEERSGQRPHLVICHLKRIKVDCNRDLLTGTGGDPNAAATWRAFHRFIREAGSTGRELYLDIHGHGHPERNIEFGYLLTNGQLKLSGEKFENLRTRSSLAGWSESGHGSFAALIRGEQSLGGLMEARGISSVPSPSKPSAGEAKYFSGGYNTVRYSRSEDGRERAAIQIETPFPGCRDTEGNRLTFARALADSLVVFLRRHGEIDLLAGEEANTLESFP